uniref:Uncharacterized protein n=1 Tax=Anopheles culicifacies TaxID=139723 RepID=A0A182MCS3_9DIPT
METSTSTTELTSTTTTESTTSTATETSTVPVTSTSTSAPISHECTTSHFSPPLVPLKNCHCYLSCDHKNCSCRSNKTRPDLNEIDKSSNRGGVRRWISKDDVYARIFKKIQKLANAPLTSTVQETTSTTTTTTPPTTTTERKSNDIVQLPVDRRRRRKLPARQMYRNQGDPSRALDQHQGSRPNGGFKRDLAHRKSEYREQLDCAIRPWTRRCKKWKTPGNVV